MKKLALILIFALFLPAAAFAKDARVIKAEQWLGALKTGQARFEQLGYDGTRLTGNFYISRPGRLRFEYDPPVKDFIVADGVFLHFYDATQNQTSTAPTGTTLADFLLRKNASLEGDLKVLNVRTKNGLVHITVAQTADPSAGQVDLRFTEEPFALKSWKIIDGQGLATEITLANLKLGVPVAPALFVYKDPSGRSRLND
ncbi:MAG: outer membrane lipoprotein carrier protein LolA [Alphaproteobacteria bacterium]|nr:outer membrane lipoprotein carrier protein LolA [Alphaproteobacteria bacterium]